MSECGSHIPEVWAHQLLLELLTCQCEYLRKKAMKHYQHMSPRHSSYIGTSMQIYHSGRFEGFSNDVGLYVSSVVGQWPRKHMLKYNEKKTSPHPFKMCSGIHVHTEKSSKTYKLQRKGIRTVTWTWSLGFEKQMKGCLFIDGTVLWMMDLSL